MMTIMGIEGNEGNDVIEDIDVLRTCHILLPYPDALAPYPLDCGQIWNFEFKKLAIAFSYPKS